ncbi:hypothetical protein PAXINDRAFT_9115 [Paxillus involutus ATCC 200175]|nr:hypothetical protein PAXINDRAFT_9115 [Paxillus involutus ATCC 200175]
MDAALTLAFNKDYNIKGLYNDKFPVYRLPVSANATCIQHSTQHIWAYQCSHSLRGVERSILHARDIPKPVTTRFRETSGRRPAVVGACTYKLANVGDKTLLTKDDHALYHFSGERLPEGGEWLRLCGGMYIGFTGPNSDRAPFPCSTSMISASIKAQPVMMSLRALAFIERPLSLSDQHHQDTRIRRWLVITQRLSSQGQHAQRIGKLGPAHEALRAIDNSSSSPLLYRNSMVADLASRSDSSRNGDLRRVRTR